MNNTEPIGDVSTLKIEAYNILRQENQYYDEMCDALNRKTATIIGFIGVIFGLEVGLLSLYNDTLTSSSECISLILAIFFTGELLFFLLSLIYAGRAYHVKYDGNERYNVFSLVDIILKGNPKEGDNSLDKDIQTMKNVTLDYAKIISQKRNLILCSQMFFIIGCIVYVIMLGVLVWVLRC